MADPIHRLLAAARQDGACQIYLVHGDLVLAEPAALAVASDLAARHGGRARGKRQVEELRDGLAALLEAARREGIEGRAEGDLSDLAELISGGLPAGHFLVFAERDVSRDHPLARLLAERGAVAAVGEVEGERRGWQGVDLLAAAPARPTGTGLSNQA